MKGEGICISQDTNRVTWGDKMAQYVLALDQGTTSSRAVLIDQESRIVGIAQKEITQYYPQPGWVEHDGEEIWNSQYNVIEELLTKVRLSLRDVKAIGVTNQRETTLVWDRKTGHPVCPAIVWQCRRTTEIVEELRGKGLNQWFRDKTGLVLDAYFSGTKLKWILDHVPGVRSRAERGELLFGTVDTWLIWKLTGGKVHATDYSNASRTMLFNIHDLTWDQDILQELNIPPCMLPEVRPSSGILGQASVGVFEHASIPIGGVAGDQQAALFGQMCFKPGMAKNTYGTGCFLLMNIGKKPARSEQGLLTTIAWGWEDHVEYALEGSVFSAGAAVQWLRDEMELIKNAAESEKYALQVPDNGGVYLVPAFVGLGAPYWDMRARGGIFGLTRGSQKAHVIRAALESLAYQTKDVLTAMEKDGQIELQTLKIDGGAAANNFLTQFQADILDVSVERAQILESTVLGVAYLAGLAVGLWKDKEQLASFYKLDQVFRPAMSAEERAHLYQSWQKAVGRCRDWED